MAKGAEGRSGRLPAVEQQTALAVAVDQLPASHHPQIPAGHGPGWAEGQLQVILHRSLPAHVDQVQGSIGRTGYLGYVGPQQRALVEPGLFVAQPKPGMIPEPFDVGRFVAGHPEIGRQLGGHRGGEAEAAYQPLQGQARVLAQDQLEVFMAEIPEPSQHGRTTGHNQVLGSDRAASGGRAQLLVAIEQGPQELSLPSQEQKRVEVVPAGLMMEPDGEQIQGDGQLVERGVALVGDQLLHRAASLPPRAVLAPFQSRRRREIGPFDPTAGHADGSGPLAVGYRMIADHENPIGAYRGVGVGQ